MSWSFIEEEIILFTLIKPIPIKDDIDRPTSYKYANILIQHILANQNYKYMIRINNKMAAHFLILGEWKNPVNKWFSSGYSGFIAQEKIHMQNSKKVQHHTNFNIKPCITNKK